jgi:hypothetical protein
MTTSTPEFYRPFDSNDFFYKRCFLCGEDLNEGNSSEEHIFPKWLQHKFDLWNQSLIIINNTQIQYRFLTIPCCKSCNNVHLSKMEEHFKRLLDNNFQNLNADDEKVIFQWTSKLLYGSIYKELSLSLDRRNPQLGNIIHPKTVEGYSALHLFLQSVRIQTVFIEPYPWSIFIFQYENDDFHYTNDYNNLCLSIKLGKIGIVIVFEDNKAVENYLSLMKGLYDYPLNHLQFLEVTSKIFYAKSLALNVSNYVTHFHMTSKEMQIRNLNSLRSKDWNDEEYALVLESLMEREGITVGRPIYNNGNITTFLVDENNELYLHKIKNGS